MTVNKTFKVISAVILALVFATSAGASGFDNRKFGVEASWTWNATGGTSHSGEDDDFTYGGNLGVCYKMTNRYGWFFEPTVGFSIGGYDFKDDNKSYGTTLYAIELPIKFGHDFKIGTTDLTVSPLVAVKPVIALGGHLNYRDVDYHWNRFNVAACLGFGILFEERFGINIRGDINLLKSIHQLPKSSGIGNHNGVVNITAKYYF